MPKVWNTRTWFLIYHMTVSVLIESFGTLTSLYVSYFIDTIIINVSKM